MRLLRLLPVPVLLAACHLLDMDAPDFRQRAFDEVGRQETLWKALAIHDYDVDFQRSCDGVVCDPIGLQPVTLHIRSDAVNRVIDSQGADVPAQAGVSWPTVDSLFLWTRQFLSDGSLVVEVQFDTTQHYPVFVRGENPGRARIVHAFANFMVQPAGTPLVSP